MLVQALIEIINPETTFLKVDGTVAPYTFHDWAVNNSKFRYTVHHTSGATNKRVIISELRNLLEYCLAANETTINRALYIMHCPTTNNDGWCGYAIIANVIQLLGIGNYVPDGVQINNIARLRELLN